MSLLAIIPNTIHPRGTSHSPTTAWESWEGPLKRFQQVVPSPLLRLAHSGVLESGIKYNGLYYINYLKGFHSWNYSAAEKSIKSKVPANFMYGRRHVFHLCSLFSSYCQCWLAYILYESWCISCIYDLTTLVIRSLQWICQLPQHCYIN